MRLVFAGTPDFAASALKALLATRHQVVGVYSQPDRPAGRGRKMTLSPVKQVAMDANIPVFQPPSLKTYEAHEQLRALDADVMIVAAYGLILPQAVLAIPRHGCLNIHASLLSRWRGAAPIQRAIAAGDSETGITIMQMDEGLDTGAMLLKSLTAIEASDTGGSLHDRLADLGGKAIVKALQLLEKGELSGEAQNNDLACYASKLSKNEGHIDWSASATAIEHLIRAFNPWPVAWCAAEDKRLRLWMATAGDDSDQPAVPGTVLSPGIDHLRIACGADGRQVLNIFQAQLPGGKALAARELLNARHTLLTPGTRLGQPLSGGTS